MVVLQHRLTHTHVIFGWFLGFFAHFPLCNLIIYLENVGLCCVVCRFIVFATWPFLFVHIFTFYHPPVVKCVLVGSPGFVKDQFISYLFKEAVRQDNKVLLENRPKFMMVHSSSGHKYSLKGASWCALGERKWRGWWNLISKWELIKVLIVLQKSCLTPQWQVGCLTLRWSCILHYLYIFF